MDMQKSGSNKYFPTAVKLLLSVPGFLLLLFALSVVYSMATNNVVLLRLQRTFSHIEHPQGAELLKHHTHLGEGPYVSGSGDDECHYYVADIRVITHSFEDTQQYYNNRSRHLSGEFSDIEIQLVPIDHTHGEYHHDIPINNWVEDFLKKDSRSAYMIFVRKSDMETPGTDYRCWRD